VRRSTPMMYLTEWPYAVYAASTNSLVDYHVVYALALIVVAFLSAWDTFGLGRTWRRLPVVRDQRWLIQPGRDPRRFRPSIVRVSERPPIADERRQAQADSDAPASSKRRRCSAITCWCSPTQSPTTEATPCRECPRSVTSYSTRGGTSA
jgi:hypothetical protein